MENIKARLHSLLDFLRPYNDLINSHMVNFITESLHEYVPSFLRDEIHSNPQIVLPIFWEHNRGEVISNNSKIGKFLNEIKTLSLNSMDGLTISINALKDKIYKGGCKVHKSIHYTEFMSSKKCHEVELMSSVVAELFEYTKCSHLIDFGDGKGYLSSILALEYKLKVLGVDSCNVNTMSAAERNRKLKKYWKGDKEKAPPVHENNFSQEVNYKQLTECITESTDLNRIVMEVFPHDEALKLGLVGLHTCGNLSPICLRHFVSHPENVFLINVSCCYHLLTESTDNSSHSQNSAGFPLSQYMLNNKAHLGRNARMLSLRAKPRLGSQQAIPKDSLLFRAIFQKILADKVGENNLRDAQVGKIAAKCSSFNQYVRKALKKLKYYFEISDEEIESYYQKFQPLREKLWIYYLFMSSFSSIIESIILLDRLLYLKEQGIENAFLVEMFDPVISPRCYGKDYILKVEESDILPPILKVCLRKLIIMMLTQSWNKFMALSWKTKCSTLQPLICGSTLPENQGYHDIDHNILQILLNF